MHRMVYKTMIKVLVILISFIFSFSACKTGSKTSMKKIIATQRSIMPADSIIQKQKRGIDLVATGNVPVTWSLDIDFDEMVYFRATDGNVLNVLPSFNKKEITTETEMYSTQTDAGELIIHIFNSPCSGTGEQFSKKVEVKLKNTTYTGCGKYLYDRQLNDIWILEMLNNATQVPAAFSKGLPYLEFNLLTNKMTGSDGCNNISSAIEIKGNRIKFSPLISTKMACNNNKVEKIFSEMLSNKLVDYYMENNKLVLYLQDDSKMIFKRKEL